MSRHKHLWQIKYDLPGGQALRECNTCPIQESRLFDYSLKSWKWFDGNLVVDERPVYILAGNFEEFIIARAHLYHREPPIPLDKIRYIRNYDSIIEGLPNPTIIFFGTWYASGILEDDRFTHVLNHRR